MPPTYDDFILFHPVFAGLDADTQGLITRSLARHAPSFPLSIWDTQERADDALMLFMCHLLTLESLLRDNLATPGGNAQEKAIEIDDTGRVEYFRLVDTRQLGSLDTLDKQLKLTSCGRELLALYLQIGGSLLGSMVVGRGVCRGRR